MMLFQSNDPQLSIILLTKIDGSSKLCFEEKYNSAIGDKIFKKGSTIDFFRCSHVFHGQCGDGSSLEVPRTVDLWRS